MTDLKPIPVPFSIHGIVKAIASRPETSDAAAADASLTDAIKPATTAFETMDRRITNFTAQLDLLEQADPAIRNTFLQNSGGDLHRVVDDVRAGIEGLLDHTHDAIATLATSAGSALGGEALSVSVFAGSIAAMTQLKARAQTTQKNLDALVSKVAQVTQPQAAEVASAPPTA
jgi:hypothetical protein